MESPKREDAATTDRKSYGIKESKMTKDLHESSMIEVQRLGQEIQPDWIGFTEEEFVYFCSFVDHDILDQIENVLREKNEVR